MDCALWAASRRAVMQRDHALHTCTIRKRALERGLRGGCPCWARRHYHYAIVTTRNLVHRITRGDLEQGRSGSHSANAARC